MKKLNARGFSHDIIMLLFVLIFAVGGVAYLVGSHADSQVAYTGTGNWAQIGNTTIDDNNHHPIQSLDVEACKYGINNNIWQVQAYFSLDGPTPLASRARTNVSSWKATVTNFGSPTPKGQQTNSDYFSSGIAPSAYVNLQVYQTTDNKLAFGYSSTNPSIPLTYVTKNIHAGNLPTCAGTTPLAPPNNVQAKYVKSTSVVLSWQHGYHGGMSIHDTSILLTTPSGEFHLSIAPGSQSYKYVTGLTPNTTYTATLAQLDGTTHIYSAKQDSAPINFTTASVDVTAPTNLIVVPGETTKDTVQIDWNTVPLPNGGHYQVYDYLTSQGATKATSVQKVTFKPSQNKGQVGTQVSPLKFKTSYSFYVRAVGSDSADISPASNTVNVTTK